MHKKIIIAACSISLIAGQLIASAAHNPKADSINTKTTLQANLLAKLAEKREPIHRDVTLPQDNSPMSRPGMLSRVYSDHYVCIILFNKYTVTINYKN